MQMQALALVVSAFLSILGGWWLAQKRVAFALVLSLALVVFWTWFNGGLSASVPELHASAGLLLLAGSGVCAAARQWLASMCVAVSVGVVWVASYYRMQIMEWVQGGNEERLHWFQLLGEVTAWGLVAVAAAVALAMWMLMRKQSD